MMDCKLGHLISALILATCALGLRAQSDPSFETRLVLNEDAAATTDWQAMEADVDGDGHLDLVLGFPEAKDERGELFVLFGPSTDWPELFSLSALAEQRHLHLTGDWPGDRFGQALAQLPAALPTETAQLAVGAPGTRLSIDPSVSGSIYLFDLSARAFPRTLSELDGKLGTRLVASARHDGLGQAFISDTGGPAVALLADSPHALWLRRAPSPAQASHLSIETDTQSVTALGRLSRFEQPRHLAFNESGGRIHRFDSGHQLSALVEEDSQQVQLVYQSDTPQGMGPLINFGDGIPDQFVLAGTQLTLDFSVSDPFEPADQLFVNFSFDATSPLILPTSAVLIGTDGIRTLIVETVSGLPDGSVPFTITVMNGQKQAAQANFLLNVINSSIPEINGGLGLNDEQLAPGDTLVKPFQVDDLLFFADNLTYAATSSNPTLIPPSSIQFDGDGSSRVIIIPTDPATSGQSLMTVTVSNPLQESVSADFLLTVGTPAGGGPEINGGAGFPDQTVTAGQLIDIPFQVSDAVEPADNLIAVATSSDQTLLSDNELLLLGNNTNRTLRINTRPDVRGTTRITVVASNSQGLSATASFDLTIQARGNPVLNFRAPVAAQQATPGQIVEWQVTVGDTFDPPNALILRAWSLNPDVLPNSAIQLSGISTTRQVRARVPEAATAGSVQIDLELVNTAGLRDTDILELTIEVPEGPIINRGEPLPDQLLTPGTPTVVEFPIAPRDGEPGVVVVVFSLDQEVLPDDALRLIGDGEDLQLEIDTALGRPGTTRIVIEATGPDGGVSQTSFEITINDQLTELDLVTESIDLNFGDQRFNRIIIENTGDIPARNVDLRLNADGQIQLISTFSQASGCGIAGDNTVRCDDRVGAGWQCQGGANARRCQINALAPAGSAILLLGSSGTDNGSVLIEVDADNAVLDSTMITPGN